MLKIVTILTYRAQRPSIYGGSDGAREKRGGEAEPLLSLQPLGVCALAAQICAGQGGRARAGSGRTLRGNETAPGAADDWGFFSAVSPSAGHHATCGIKPFLPEFIITLSDE